MEVGVSMQSIDYTHLTLNGDVSLTLTPLFKATSKFGKVGKSLAHGGRAVLPPELCIGPIRDASAVTCAKLLKISHLS